MNRRRGKSSDRISLKVALAVCVVSFIVGVAYTKTDRTVMLLNSIATEPQAPGTPVQDVAANPRVQQAPEAQAPKSVPDGIAQPTFSPEKRETRDERRETNEQPGEWRTVRMRVTGYCPCPKCCGEYSDGVTANGHKIQPGDTFVAADKRYAFGTELIIPGYNNSQVVKVLDRGGAIRGDKLDAFFHTHQAALEWGVKYLDVQVKIN